MASAVELLRRVYDRFNARDLEGVLGTMHADVMGANGMEGGHVRGRDGVRSYWSRQWSIIDPHVEPLGFSAGSDGEIIVQVHQTVRDLAGKLLSDTMVGHVFRVEDGLVRQFDIRKT